MKLVFTQTGAEVTTVTEEAAERLIASGCFKPVEETKPKPKPKKKAATRKAVASDK